MSLENIIEKINSKRDEEIRELKNKREREISVFSEELEEKAEKDLMNLIQEYDGDIEIFKNLRISQAKRQVKQSDLETKEKLINETLEKVRKDLEEFKGPRYESILKKLVKEGKEILDTHCILIPSRKEDIPFLESLDAGSVSNEIIHGSGGLIMVSLEGDLKLNRTFDFFMEKKRDELRHMIAHELFKNDV